MSETSDLKTKQTFICGDCEYVLPVGSIWFCPGCLANLCNECLEFHKCTIKK
jgi:hypothetical protein